MGFSYLCTYDIYSPVHNVLDVCISITRASGRGLGPGNRSHEKKDQKIKRKNNVANWVGSYCIMVGMERKDEEECIYRIKRKRRTEIRNYFKNI